MACYHPLHGWRSRKTGKFTLRLSEAWHDIDETVPCGQCIGCRLERSRQWAVRCMHEASLSDENCFITLTYRDDAMPASCSLDKQAFPKFMKRLRRRYGSKRIRFFHAGEYGELSSRPHYHACVFGFDFPDKVLFTVRKGYPVWTSDVLSSLWPFGLSEVGSVTFQSAAYVARYIVKKVTGLSAARHYGGRVPEYTTMSRRPGLGKEWYDRYKCEVYPADSVVVRGHLCKPPRYYDKQYEIGAPVDFARIKRERAKGRKVRDETPERLAVREVCANARLKALGDRGL